MKILRFDHMHVKPNDFDAFNEKFQKFMGMNYLMNMPMPEYGTDVAYEPFPIGLEAFRPTDPSASPSARMASESQGVFVICYRVENLEEAIVEMENEFGWKMVMYTDNQGIKEALFDTKDDLSFNIELTETPFDNLRETMMAQYQQ